METQTQALAGTAALATAIAAAIVAATAAAVAAAAAKLYRKESLQHLPRWMYIC